MTDNPTLDDFAAQYEATQSRITEMLALLSPADEETIVPACPAWTIRDLLSHVAGLAAEFASGATVPGVGVQDWVDQMVAHRSSIPVREQLDEWSRTGRVLADVMRKDSVTGRLLNDIVAHEHDFAHALGTRGDRESRGLEISMDILKPNSINRDLAAHGLAAVVLDAGDRQWHFGEGPIELTVRGTMFELYRLTGGRRSRSQLLACDHDGDMDRYVAGLVHLPLAEHDLIENSL